VSERPERSPYEAASIVFGAVIVLFGVWGAAKTIANGDGPGSAEFLISCVFIALGAGRVWLALRRR
jgi:hypothetical protein